MIRTVKVNRRKPAQSSALVADPAEFPRQFSPSRDRTSRTSSLGGGRQRLLRRQMYVGAAQLVVDNQAGTVCRLELPLQRREN